MTILDASGRPLAPALPRSVGRTGRAGAFTPEVRDGFSKAAVYPYRASELQSQEMGTDWYPTIRSPDGEHNRFRDRLVGRGRDLHRNDGFARGAIDRILDNTIGGYYRLSSAPDYQALKHLTGNAAFDAVWADEYRRAVEARWRTFSQSPGRFNDVSRQLTVSQQMRLAAKHRLIDGEDLVLAYWKPERVYAGGADYATCFLVVDPDRLSNPYQQMDNANMRGGVEIDDDGVPVAYHIRRAHQNDTYSVQEAMEWDRVEREDEDGWRRVIHDFDRDRAGQNRGIGLFTPILPHAKMLASYYGIELQSAALGAVFGTYIRSEQDPAMMEDLIGGEGDQLTPLQDFRADWYGENPVRFNGVKLPILSPGDSIESVASAHPHTGFNDFAHEMHRMMAAGLGVSAEQLSQTWAEMNYSSARASMLEIWKTMERRSLDFANGTATPWFATWLHEAFEREEFDDINPRGAPSYPEARAAYSRCTWLGPGRGWIDPVKEPQGSTMAMDAGLTTLKRECAENGRDWEEEAEQRAIELQKFKELGIPPPTFFNSPSAQQASTPETKPEAL